MGLSLIMPASRSSGVVTALRGSLGHSHFSDVRSNAAGNGRSSTWPHRTLNLFYLFQGHRQYQFLILLRSSHNKHAIEILRRRLETYFARPLSTLLPSDDTGRRSAMLLSVIADFQAMRHVVELAGRTDSVAATLSNLFRRPRSSACRRVIIGPARNRGGHSIGMKRHGCEYKATSGKNRNPGLHGEWGRANDQLSKSSIGAQGLLPLCL